MKDVSGKAKNYVNITTIKIVRLRCTSVIPVNNQVNDEWTITAHPVPDVSCKEKQQ